MEEILKYFSLIGEVLEQPLTQDNTLYIQMSIQQVSRMENNI